MARRQAPAGQEHRRQHDDEQRPQIVDEIGFDRRRQAQREKQQEMEAEQPADAEQQACAVARAIAANATRRVTRRSRAHNRSTGTAAGAQATSPSAASVLHSRIAPAAASSGNAHRARRPAGAGAWVAPRASSVPAAERSVDAMSLTPERDPFRRLRSSRAQRATAAVPRPRARFARVGWRTTASGGETIGAHSARRTRAPTRRPASGTPSRCRTRSNDNAIALLLAMIAVGGRGAPGRRRSGARTPLRRIRAAERRGHVGTRRGGAREKALDALLRCWRGADRARRREGCGDPSPIRWRVASRIALKSSIADVVETPVAGHAVDDHGRRARARRAGRASPANRTSG